MIGSEFMAESSKKKQILVIVGAIFGFLIILSVILYIGAQVWYQQSIKPRSDQPQDILVEIERGKSANEIANLLEEKNIIRSSTAFNWYVDRKEVRNKLQAGVYRLSPSYSVKEIVDILVSGDVDTQLVTITPGIRLDEVEQLLLKAGFEQSEITEALNASYDHPLLAYKPEEASLEGYIFPETYQINSETTVKELFIESFNVFFAQLSGDITGGIEAQGLTLHEGIILASIVQQEVPDYPTQQKVAQVFLKRLQLGIPLGADPTFRYASYQEGIKDSVSVDNPYNTRIYAGLPPGPIGNFNTGALKAVSEPADTDFLYFVAGDDGITRFSNTLEEHEQNVKEYCKQLCKL